ncbi:MAG: hypothetical protein U1F35_03695 [Steroidobacteraceae bacterium]
MSLWVPSNRARLMAAMLFLPCLAFLAFVAVADEHGASRQTANTPEARLYRDECGSCHVAFPPRALPASSWKAIMAGLDQHFDTDASIDPALNRTIDAWLAANAGVERAPSLAKPLLQITETSWFRHEHDEMTPAALRRLGVKTLSDCGGCHTRAAEGRFSEHELRVRE